MPRRRRFHLPNGVYYLSLIRDRELPPLFCGEADFITFERILTKVLPATQSQALAFSWEHWAIRLVLQIGEVTTGRIVQQVLSQYARLTRRRVQPHEQSLVARHRAVLVNAEQLLLKLIHLVHWAPVLTVPNGHPDVYERSSHPYYLRPEESPLWLNTQLALERWGTDRATALNNYRAYIDTPPSTEDIDRFERDPKRESRALDRENFLSDSPPHLSVPNITLKYVIEVVSRYFNVNAARLLTGPRGRKYTLMRALITWHALQRHIATVSEISEWLQRNPKTLLRAIRRYRRRRPSAALFKKSAFPELDGANPAASSPHSRITLERIIDVVSRRCNVDPEKILAGARGRQYTLIRAVITCHARLRPGTTWAEIAARLRRSPWSLRVAMRRYRNQRRHRRLFKINAFPELDEPVQVKSAETMAG